MHPWISITVLSTLLCMGCFDEIKTSPVAPKDAFDRADNSNVPTDPNAAKKRKQLPGVPIPTDPTEAERFFGWIEKLTSNKPAERDAGVQAIRKANLPAAKLKQFLAVAKHYGATAEQLAPLGRK